MNVNEMGLWEVEVTSPLRVRPKPLSLQKWMERDNIILMTLVTDGAQVNPLAQGPEPISLAPT